MSKRIPSGRPRGRRPQSVIGTREDGETVLWANMKEAAAALGTSPGTLRLYMCMDKPYKGYDLDYEPDRQTYLL